MLLEIKVKGTITINAQDKNNSSVTVTSHIESIIPSLSQEPLPTLSAFNTRSKAIFYLGSKALLDEMCHFQGEELH